MADEKPSVKEPSFARKALSYTLMGIGSGLTGTDFLGNFLKWKAQQDEANEIDPWVDIKNKEIDIADRKLKIDEREERQKNLATIKEYISSLKEEYGGDYEKASKDLQESLPLLKDAYGIEEKEVMGLFGEQFKPEQKTEKVVNLSPSAKSGIALGAGALALSPALRQSILGGGARTLGMAGQLVKPVALGALGGNLAGNLLADAMPKGAFASDGEQIGRNSFLRWLATSRPEFLGGMNQEDRQLVNQMYGR